MTPVRAALRPSSALLPRVSDGLDGVNRGHRRLIDTAIRALFSDSLDLDAALRTQRPQDNRWDYLVGHAGSGKVVGLEPHSAATGEVSTVIAKRAAARAQLQDHFRRGAAVAAWFWVASGRVDFVPHDKAMMRLLQAGITFVGGRVLAKHLSELASDSG